MFKKIALNFVLALSASFYCAQPVFIKNNTEYTLSVRGEFYHSITLVAGSMGEIKNSGQALSFFLDCPYKTSVERMHPGKFCVRPGGQLKSFDVNTTLVVTYDGIEPRVVIQPLGG